MKKTFNNMYIIVLLLYCNIIALTANAQGTGFAPWDKTTWGSYYDEQGRVIKPFPISGDVVFETRTTPWELTLSPDFVGSSLFNIQGRGLTIDGNGIEIDATEAVHRQSLENMYVAGRAIWDNVPTVSCLYYSQTNQNGVNATIIKNFTVKGFYRGVRLGNPNNTAHAVIIENCVLARNVIGLYTNGNNALIQNNQIIENGFCGVYSGYRSYGNTFTQNTFRDNVLFQAQASYGDFVGDTYYNTNITNNIFAKSLVNNASLKHIGISIYRNEGEDNNLREDIPHNNIIQGNQFNDCSLAIHVASRMGRNPNYDITREGRDYAFYNQIKNNQLNNCIVGIKINSEGNIIDGNTFTNTSYPIVLHPVFFKLKNTTINNQPNETVYIWYVKSDYSAVPNQAYLFDFQDNINGAILRTEKRVEIFSTVGTPGFSAVGGLNANEFKLNPEVPEDLLWDHRVGNPIIKKYGEFQVNLPGEEIAAIWDQKISRVKNIDYYSILIFDENGTEINRCGRSETGWSQLAVGYFTRTSGEMEVAAVPKTAIDGKYPVYIFRRGYADPERILYPDNIDPGIRISTDSNHQLVVTFGSLLAWQFTAVPEGNNRGTNPTGNTDGRETTVGSYITDSGIEQSYLKRGSGVGLSSALVRTFNGVFPNGGTEADALDNDRYYEFTVKAKTGFKVSLNSLNIKLRRSGETAPNSFKWMYNVNAVGKPDAEKVFSELSTFNYSVISDATNGDSQTPVDLSLYNALQNVDENREITFRIYAWGATAANTSVAVGRFANNVSAINANVMVIEGEVKENKIASILSWQFTDVPEGNNRGTNPTGNTDGRETAVGSYITDSGIEQSYLKRGTGVGLPSALVRTFNGIFPNGETETDALDNDRYYEFTVKAKTGFRVSLNTLDIKLRRSGETAPNNFKWVYSVNAVGKPDTEKVFTELSTFNYSVISDATNGDSQTPINLALYNALQNVDENREITFRLYAWGATGTNTSVAIGRFANNISAVNAITLNIKGSVEEVITTPVKLTAFTAKREGNEVKLNWQTASENDSSHFDVLRILDNKRTLVLGTVPRMGTSASVNNYSFIDFKPVEGVNYYQLQQVDFDGKTDLSEIIALNFSFDDAGFKVYTLSDDPYITLFVSSEKATTENIRITDMSGKVLLNTPLKMEAGQNTIRLPILLIKGIYLAQLQNKVVKFIK